MVLDFHPISLFNVLYKPMSKAIANRLKVYFPLLILEFQSAFMPRRQITNNVLIVYELIYFLRLKNRGKHDFMSIKLNMSKSYDRVEWHYLEHVLNVLSYHHWFVNLIMSCVRSTSFSILINGTPHGSVIPSRGLRQRDPISPYLFVLCTEGLVTLLQQSIAHHGLVGIRVCWHAPNINHLSFSDNSLIFYKASHSSS